MVCLGLLLAKLFRETQTLGQREEMLRVSSQMAHSKTQLRGHKKSECQNRLTVPVAQILRAWETWFLEKDPWLVA